MGKRVGNIKISFLLSIDVYRLFLISRILVEEFSGPLLLASTLMVMRFNNKTFHDVIHFLCTPRDIIDFGMRQFATWG